MNATPSRKPSLKELVEEGRFIAAAQRIKRRPNMDLSDRLQIVRDIVQGLQGLSNGAEARRQLHHLLGRCPNLIRAEHLRVLVAANENEKAQELGQLMVEAGHSPRVIAEAGDELRQLGVPLRGRDLALHCADQNPTNFQHQTNAFKALVERGDWEEATALFNLLRVRFSDEDTAFELEIMRQTIEARGWAVDKVGEAEAARSGHQDIGRGVTMRPSASGRHAIFLRGVSPLKSLKMLDGIDAELARQGIGLIQIRSKDRALHLDGFADWPDWDASAAGFGALLREHGVREAFPIGFSGTGAASFRLAADLGLPGLLGFSAITRLPDTGEDWGGRVSRSLSRVRKGLPEGDYDARACLDRHPMVVDLHYPQNSPFDAHMAERMADLPGVVLHPQDTAKHSVLQVDTFGAALGSFLHRLGWD